MKTKVLDVREFASGAEAGAYYFERGFATFDEADDARYMRNADHSQEVRIKRIGFLHWEVSHIEVC